MAGHVLFDGVWKRFRRGLAHDSLRDMIPAMTRRLRGGGPKTQELRDNDFWALRDVSFEVKPGEALGIIGGNGAGKSTTLKLLTKVLVPTRGTALIRGRTGALIEVSAGFHPDLTGRENVFLQGAIMGMPMQLIRERFDDIVEFSGIAPFIDTPVKRYSSGMNARLGFSIAAHLEPEVLIIDEVLSVGDTEFQARAFGRIKNLVGAGIPVVIVSHQLDRVVELCTDCILLRQGKVAFHGLPRDAVQAYLQGAGGSDDEAAETTASLGIRISTLAGPEPQPVMSGGMFTARVAGAVTEAAPPPHVEIGVSIVDAATNQQMTRVSFRSLGVHPTKGGEFAVDFKMQANLPAGLYRFDTCVWHDQREILIQGPSKIFQVMPAAQFHGTHQLNAVATPA
jgi:ABC-type polysaccharide/polyol phosphate transport system ATPase subunit